MFRRLIGWLKEKRQEWIWRRELLTNFPTRQSFLEANDLRVNRERDVLAAVADHNFKRGYQKAREDTVNAKQKWVWVDMGTVH